MTRPSALCSLAMAAALAAMLGTAAAKPVGLAKLKAKTTGTFTASASGGIYGNFNSSGSARAVFKANSEGTTGKLIIKSKSKDSDAAYPATIKFQANGTCTTTVIVPGMGTTKGEGTWKLSGKKLTYSLTGRDTLTSYVLEATIRKAGKKLTVDAKVIITSLVPGSPTAAAYAFK